MAKVSFNIYLESSTFANVTLRFRLSALSRSRHRLLKHHFLDFSSRKISPTPSSLLPISETLLVFPPLSFFNVNE